MGGHDETCLTLNAEANRGGWLTSCKCVIGHDALCLTASGDDLCTCDAIAACKAATHAPGCPMRNHTTHAHDGYVDDCECPYLVGDGLL